MEYHILNDQDLSFKDIMKRHLSGESLVNLKEKKLYDDMRIKAAAAREEIKASKKEDVEEIKDDKDAGGDLADTKEAEKNASLAEEAEKCDSKNEESDDKIEDQNDEKDSSKSDKSSDSNDKDIANEIIEGVEKVLENKVEEAKAKVAKLKLKKKKMKGKFKKGKKRGPGRPPKNTEKDNPFVEDDLDDFEPMDLGAVDDDGAPIVAKPAQEKPPKRKPGRPPGRPNKKSIDISEIKNDETDGRRSTRSDMKGAMNSFTKSDVSPSKGSVTLTPVKKSSEQNSPPKRKGGFVNVSIDPPQISLQQMEQMARGGVYDIEMMTDLMQQTYAAAIKWPKDRILTIRLEHIMEAVESGKWPVPKDFSYAEAAQLTIPESPTPVEGTPVKEDTPTPAMSESGTSELSNPYEEPNILTPGRKPGQRGRKPLDRTAPPLHSPEMIDKSSKIRSLLSAGQHTRSNQEHDEIMR